MKIGIIGSAVSRIKAALLKSVEKVRKADEAPGGIVNHAKEAKAWMVRVWTTDRASGFFGPAFCYPREDHHKSRQSCRAYLRDLMFKAASEKFPLASRRDRRRYARLCAKLEYRNMMQDQTNAIPEVEESLYARASALELKPAFNPA